MTHPASVRIDIDLTLQRLQLKSEGGEIVATYPVSTGLNGPGESDGSKNKKE